MSAFLFSFLFGSIAVKAQQTMNLHLFPKNEAGSQCLDGTPAGFYYSLPPSGSSNLWVIYLKGGGACHDEKSCMQRANSSLGSSNYWQDTYNPGKSVNSDEASVNPYFYQAHQVFAPYCSGDVWSGQRTKPSAVNPNTWGLYFSGHLIFERLIQYLSYNLSDSLLDAQYILLSGGSAGGMGTFANINWLYTEMKKYG
eukprot:241866_1